MEYEVKLVPLPIIEVKPSDFVEGVSLISVTIMEAEELLERFPDPTPSNATPHTSHEEPGT